jgi:hypothetical protein
MEHTITTQPSKILAIISNQAIDLGNNIVRRNADFKNFTYKAGPDDGYDNGKEKYGENITGCDCLDRYCPESKGGQIGILIFLGACLGAISYACCCYKQENGKPLINGDCCEAMFKTLGNGIARNLELQTLGAVKIPQETVDYDNI